MSIHREKESGLPLEWPTSILVTSLLKRQKKTVPHGIRLVAKPKGRDESIRGTGRKWTILRALAPGAATVKAILGS